MRTAVSMSDQTFERAEALANSMGLSRSDYYADMLERSSLTTRIDAAIPRSGIDVEPTLDVVGTGRATLSADGDGW